MSPMFEPRRRLVIGELVETGDRIYRVGYVNECRARLDRLGVEAATTTDGSGETVSHHSINIAPTSTVRRLSAEEIGTTDQDTLALVRQRRSSTEGEEEMAAEAAVAGVPVAARSPKAAKPVNGAAGKPRIAKVAGAPVAAKSAKSAQPKVAREKTPKVQKPCACGCGASTGGYFVPGHDARFKSWLLKIEKGEATPEQTPMPRKVRELFTWKKKGAGLIPTTNYKGEKHAGYLA